MKKNIFLIIGLTACVNLLHAQTEEDNNAIKLFVEPDSIAMKNSELPANLQSRLYTKITHLINQTGTAEVGYSNFWVLPKFDILSTSVNEAGIGKVYMAECELSISIARREFGKSGGAIYQSFSKKIVGSALTKDEALSKAINSISTSDEQVIDFFTKAKAKINEYFKTHCKDIIKEAEQAYKLNDYGRSIALYFSIPSNAPCYPDARDASIKVYKTYMNDQCRKDLVYLKALVATIQTKDLVSMDAYNKAMNIIRDMSPSSTDCYAEALVEIKKVEKKFDDAQKHQWEVEQKRETNTVEVQKEMLRAMGKINSSYQPGTPAGTIIIAK